MKTQLKKFINSHWLAMFVAAALIGLSMKTFSGDKQYPAPPEIRYSSNGNVNSPEFTENPVSKIKSSKETELENQLEAARISGNTVSAQRIQAELNQMRGVVLSVNGQEPTHHELGLNIPVPETDYSQAQIHNLSIMSHAFGIVPAGAPNAGRLWYVTTVYAPSGADTIKYYYSSNNGSSWVLYGSSSLNYNNSYNNDELDIELVYDGTNVWMFVVAGLTDIQNGGKKCHFIRFNTAGGGAWSSILSFPGGSSATTTYNPRITSDNSVFNSNAYVMMLCSQDSTAGSTHYVKQKYALLTSPFAGSLSFDYSQPNNSNGFYWSGDNGSNTNTFLYGDIAYYKDDGGTGENRVMSVYSNYGSGFNNIYIAYLTNYTTTGSSLVISETSVNKGAKIAFNGGTSNRNGMITYLRMFNSTDWDVFAFKTTNGGSNAAGWTRDTIDFSGDFARSVDIIAVRNAANQFKVSYSQSVTNVTNGYYRGYNGTWTPKTLFTTNGVDSVFAKPRAGYITGGGDDGAVCWSAIGGVNGYLSKQIISTTGISGTNEIPSGFSLSQNYPNPFNPVTNIKFSIPVSGIVTLKIYDITGKEVAEIVNRNMNAGSYTLDFDASNLSSGAYFYKLSANGFTDVKKMMLVK